MFDIEREIRNALIRYADGGDKTYECIAFTVSDNTVSDCKTYRFCKIESLKKIEANLNIPHQYINDLTECSGTNMELFEASVRESNDTKYARFVMKMKTNISLEERNDCLKRFTDRFDRFHAYPIISSISEILETSISPRRSTITQMGIEIENGGTIAAIKSYFSLRPYGYCVEKFGQFPALEHIEDVIHVLWETLGFSSEQNALLKSYSDLLLKYNYFPFLLGLTHRASSAECKIYYVLYPRKTFADIFVQHEQSLLRELDCLQFFKDGGSETLKKIDSMQQCLRGLSLAFSKETQSKINLFFGPK